MGRTKRLRKLKRANRKAKQIEALHKHRADVLMQKFIDAFPGIDKMRLAVLERLSESEVKVCVMRSPDQSSLAIGEAFHRAISDRTHTVSTVIHDEIPNIEASVYTEVLQKLDEGQFKLPMLDMKKFAEIDQLTPPAFTSPDTFKKTKTFNVKKYF